MAGILVGDAQRKRLHFGGETESGEKFGDVASLGGKSAGWAVFFFVRRKKMVVFLERGAAAGGIGEDGVEIAAEKYRDIFSRKFPRRIANAGVSGQRAAAGLPLGNDDFAAVGGEHANGSFVELRKSDVGDATRKESHAGAPRTGGGKRPAMTAIEKTVVDAREELLAVGEAKKIQDAHAAGNGPQARALVEPEHSRQIDYAVGIREQVTENEAARDGRKPGAGIFALDSRPGVLDEFPILDSRRAGGFASAAVEAFVDVIDKTIRDGLLVQLHLDHLVDTAARRIGLQVPEPVGGTGIEAKTAVDAAGVVLVDGSGAGDGQRGHGLVEDDDKASAAASEGRGLSRF